jgi:endonuclease YncB( thermonuclease family)
MRICFRTKTAFDGRCRAAALALLSTVLLLAASSVAGGRSQDCLKVLRVYDGDTVLISDPSGRGLVRLLGIDAPETSKSRGQAGQPFSARSRRYLAGRILNRCVQLEVYGVDRYDRRLAVIHLEGANINLEMVTRGLAEVYRGRTPQGFDRRPYRQAAETARREGRGMWAQGEAYRSPMEWKHGP